MVQEYSAKIYPEVFTNTYLYKDYTTISSQLIYFVKRNKKKFWFSFQTMQDEYAYATSIYLCLGKS